MTELDTFDTLKYGHVPLNHLLDYAKTKNINFTNFILDDIDNSVLRYKNIIGLYFDGDFYYIDCYIYQPGYDDGMDITTQVSIHFYLGNHIDNEIERNYPYFSLNDEEYLISSREQFVDVLLLDWKIFVQKSIGEILSHRLEIMENLDDIVKSENNTHYKSNKIDYIKVLNKISNHLSINIKNIINFNEVKDWNEI